MNEWEQLLHAVCWVVVVVGGICDYLKASDKEV